MQQREWITMTAREQRRAHVLARVIAGELKLWEAAVVLGLSVRQARRLKRALVREGPAALAHANRGRASPRRFSPTLRQHVVRLYQTIYRGLNHQHFCELLAEHEQLQLSVASVRRILRTAGFGSPQYSAAAGAWRQLKRSAWVAELGDRKCSACSPVWWICPWFKWTSGMGGPAIGCWSQCASTPTSDSELLESWTRFDACMPPGMSASPNDGRPTPTSAGLVARQLSPRLNTSWTTCERRCAGVLTLATHLRACGSPERIGISGLSEAPSPR